MNKHFSSLLLVAVSAVALAACDYSNEFSGTYNGQPANLSAYSKNVKKYCVSLDLVAGDTEIQSFISAQDVYNANDWFATKSFNTKGADCAANLDQYIEGSRATKILSTGESSREENINTSFCRTIYYKTYQYQETITFNLHNNSDDRTVGTFSGEGNVSTYSDTDHPTRIGATYQCGPIYNGPYPGGYPGGYPYPGQYPGQYPGGYPYPGQYPGQFPGGYPYPGHYPGGFGGYPGRF